MLAKHLLPFEQREPSQIKVVVVRQIQCRWGKKRGTQESVNGKWKMEKDPQDPKMQKIMSIKHEKKSEIKRPKNQMLWFPHFPSPCKRRKSSI